MKDNKKFLLGLITGGIIFGCIGVRATYLYESKQVSYNNENTETDNVKSALDELYDKSKNIISDVSLSMSNVISGDGTITRSFTAESDGEYLVSVANSKSKLNCSNSSSSVSILGQSEIEVLYNQISDFGWNGDGGNQQRLYVAKITATAGSTITITVSNGNGYPIAHMAVVRLS